MDHDFQKKLVLHLLLLMMPMKELGWVLQMARLIVLVKENLRVHCLNHDLEKKLVLHLLLLMLLMKEHVKKMLQHCTFRIRGKPIISCIKQLIRSDLHHCQFDAIEDSYKNAETK